MHSRAPGSIDVTLGASELLPIVAILPFMLYQLAGYGTLSFIVPKIVNWILNLAVLGLIIASYVTNREGEYSWERKATGVLVIGMALTVFYGVLKLRQMQKTYDEHAPPKPAK